MFTSALIIEFSSSSSQGKRLICQRARVSGFGEKKIGLSPAVPDVQKRSIFRDAQKTLIISPQNICLFIMHLMQREFVSLFHLLFRSFQCHLPVYSPKLTRQLLRCISSRAFHILLFFKGVSHIIHVTQMSCIVLMKNSNKSDDLWNYFNQLTKANIINSITM